MFKGQLFELINRSSESLGFIFTSNTDISANYIEDLWKEYCNSFSEDVDDFVNWINSKEEIIDTFEKVYITETYAN